MADEKLNTGPAENISPEAAEPITTPEQTGPAIPESGDVVVSFDKINELMAEKRQKGRHCFRVLSDYHNLLRRWKRDYAPKTPDEEWHPLFVEALQKQAHVEYLLDVLLFSDIEERAALIASYGKEVRNLERRMADLAARTAAGRDRHHRSRTPAPER